MSVQILDAAISPCSVPPAVAGGLAVKEPDEGEELWRNLAKLAEEGYAGHGVVRAPAIQRHKDRAWAQGQGGPHAGLPARA